MGLVEAGKVEVFPTHYLRDGVRYDRVTEILKWLPQPGLADWRESVGRARANRDLHHAEKVGKEVDRLITGILNGQPVKKSPDSVEVRQALRGFTEWHRLNPIQPVATQTTLFHEGLKIGGTPDCWTAEEVLDWKTSSRMQPRHILQLIAYMKLLQLQMFPIERGRIVRFDKILGTWEERLVSWDDKLWQMVEHLVQAYQHWQAWTDSPRGADT